MADEVVRTQFLLETQQFDEKLERMTKGMREYDDATDRATQENKELGNSVGSASAKLKQLEQAAGGAGKGVGQLSTSAGGAREIFKTMRGELDAAFPVFGRIATAARAMGTAVTTAFGPIGLVVAAVVAAFGLLVKIFADTEKGGERIARVIEPVKAVLAATLGVIQKVATAAVDAVSLLFDLATFDFSGAAEGFTNLGKSASEAGRAVVGFGGTVQEAASKGRRLADLKEELEDLAISIATEEGRINREFQEQFLIAGNVNATNEERLAAGKEAIRLQKELTDLKLRELDLEIEQLEIQQSLNDTSDEELLELAKLKAARDQLVADQLSATRRVTNTINTINKQAADAAIAEAKRRADEEKKRLEEVKEAEQSLADFRRELGSRALARTLDDYGKSVLAAEEAAQDEERAVAELFEKLRALNAGNKEELEKLRKDEADAIAAIRRDLNAELDLLEQQRIKKDEDARQKELDAIEKATQTEAEVQRAAINEEFDKLKSAAERRITDEAELTETLVELERARLGKLAEVRDKDAEEREKKEKEEKERLIASREETLGTLTSASEQLGALVGAAAQGQTDIAAQAGKQLAAIAFDTVGKIVEAQIVQLIAGNAARGAQLAGPPGAFAAFAAGTALGAVIRALLRQVGSQIVGAYTGESYVSGAPTFSGKDGHLRRLHTGERVVTSKTNAEYYDLFEAAEAGKLRKYVEAHYAVNAIVQSDTGQRIASSVMLAPYYDKGIVRAETRTREAIEEQTRLLVALLGQKGTKRHGHRRYYA